MRVLEGDALNRNFNIWDFLKAVPSVNSLALRPAGPPGSPRLSSGQERPTGGLNLTFLGGDSRNLTNQRFLPIRWLRKNILYT